MLKSMLFSGGLVGVLLMICLVCVTVLAGWGVGMLLCKLGSRALDGIADHIEVLE